MRTALIYLPHLQPKDREKMPYALEKLMHHDTDGEVFKVATEGGAAQDMDRTDSKRFVRSARYHVFLGEQQPPRCDHEMRIAGKK